MGFISDRHLAGTEERRIFFELRTKFLNIIYIYESRFQWREGSQNVLLRPDLRPFQSSHHVRQLQTYTMNNRCQLKLASRLTVRLLLVLPSHSLHSQSSSTGQFSAKFISAFQFTLTNSMC
jgi:hypothetical protein